jgi:hypothetical protein
MHHFYILNFNENKMAKNLSSSKNKNIPKEQTIVRPQLADIQRELAIYFGSIGVLLNEMYRPGAGARLFEISDQESLYGVADKIDVSTTAIGQYLPVFYAYAYDGQLLPGYEKMVDPYGNNIATEHLRDFIEIFATPTSEYLELADDVATGSGQTPFGGLKDLVDRMSARHSLDSKDAMSIDEIALLANMNERSVRNATTAVGKNRLPLNGQGCVDHHVALQWLAERDGRGFTPTRLVQFPADVAENNVQLTAFEIPAFIEDRLRARFGEAAKAAWKLELDSYSENASPLELQSQWSRIFEQSAKLAQLSEADIRKASDYPLAIQPSHCAGLAKALGVDPTWFTLQVMRALYPQEMDMILNPSHYLAPKTGIEATEEALSAIEIILTKAMIKHGYLDMPAHAKMLFPVDCFSEKNEEERGASVIIQYGMDQQVETDLLIKSEKTISPRSRFTAWLQSELPANPGDRVRVERQAERLYVLKFQPVVAISTP